MNKQGRNKILISLVGAAFVVAAIFFSTWNIATFQKDVRTEKENDLFFASDIVNNLIIESIWSAQKTLNELSQEPDLVEEITKIAAQNKASANQFYHIISKYTLAFDSITFVGSQGLSTHLYRENSLQRFFNTEQIGFSDDLEYWKDQQFPYSKQDKISLTQSGHYLNIMHPVFGPDGFAGYIKLVYHIDALYEHLKPLFAKKGFRIDITDDHVKSLISVLQPKQVDSVGNKHPAYEAEINGLIQSLELKQKATASYHGPQSIKWLTVKSPTKYEGISCNVLASTNYAAVTKPVKAFRERVIVVLVTSIVLMIIMFLFAWNITLGSIKLKREKDYMRKLSISENRYWSMFDASPVPMLIHNPEGDIINTNHEMVKFMQVNGRKELIGKSVFALFEPEQHPYFRSKIKNLILSKTQRERCVLKVQPKGGLVKYTEVVSSVFVFDKKKNVQLVMIDLTQKREAESLSLRFNKILTDSYNEIYFFNADNYKFIQVTKGALQTLGYTAEEIVTMTPLDITRYTPEEFTRLLAPLINEEQSQLVFETIHRRKDGSTYPIEVRLQLSRDESPAIFIANIQNLSERKEASKKLEERDRLINALSDASFEAVILSKNGQCIGLNLAAENMFGYSFEEAINKEIKSWVTTAYRESMQAFMDSGYEGSIRGSGLRKDGSSFSCEIKGRISIFEGEEITVISVNDITEQLRAEKELILAKEKAEESDKLKSAFLANISHEIRTPMNGIIGFSQLLKSQDLDEEEMKMYIDTIDNCSNYLLSIINDIINISRIETGSIELFEEKTSVNELLESSINQHSLHAENKHLKIECSDKLSEQDDLVLADEKKVRNVLNNLIDNAIKFTQKGRIGIGCQRKGGFLEFYISDTGIGISETNQSVIFERFRQAELEADNLYGGTGLGLAISKAYIERMGGSIWVESTLKSGSTFYFTIPHKPLNKAKAGHPKGEIKKMDFSGKNILVAEDEEANFQYLRLLLDHTGANVLRAKNGQEAVDICQKNDQIDLVLMDMKMPKMDGYEATKSIKGFAPHIPIIAQTAYALVHDSKLAMDAGCDDYISKPINRVLIMEKIANFLDK